MKKIIVNEETCIYYNVDDNKLNYTQRNNKYRWGDNNKNAKINYATTCNVTSICMALDYAGFKMPCGDFEQPEDNLAKWIMESKLVDDEYKRRYPAMYNDFKNDKPGCYTPNEIHKLLEIGVNEWMGAEVDTFSDSVQVSDIIDDIACRCKPVAVSGAFPQKKENGSTVIFNHIVCLVGVAFKEDDLECPKYFVIDDPWGYTHNYGLGKSGNDIFISSERFFSWMKPVNNRIIKYAHRFNNPVAIV